MTETKSQIDTKAISNVLYLVRNIIDNIETQIEHGQARIVSANNEISEWIFNVDFPKSIIDTLKKQEKIARESLDRR